MKYQFVPDMSVDHLTSVGLITSRGKYQTCSFEKFTPFKKLFLFE